MFFDSSKSSREVGYAAPAVAARFMFMVPQAVVYLFVYLFRLIRRWRMATLAQGWSTADAVIGDTYELDENQSALSLNGWTPSIDDDNNPDYRARWAVALQYTYEVGGELYSGTYFLPGTFRDADLASEAEKAWTGKKIIVRYNPSKPRQSVFLEEDGAPGKPHIPRFISDKPYLTNLSLK